MRRILTILAALFIVFGMSSCGLQEDFTEMGFGFEAEGPTVTTYFSDGLESKTGGFTFYNMSDEAVDIYINACDGSENIVIEELKAGCPCWHRVEKKTAYAIGFRTDAPVGTEMEITIIDGNQMKADAEAEDIDSGSAYLAPPMQIEPHLAAAVGGDGPLVDEALIYTGNATSVQDGIRVTAKQAVADKHNMYILLQVTTKKDIDFTFEDRFEEVMFGIEGAWTSSDLCWYSVSKDGVMYIVLGMSTGECLDKGTAEIMLKNLVNCDEGELVYYGNWNIEFDFKVADVTKCFESDSVIHHNGVDLKLNQLDVSPFAAYISCTLAEESEKPDDDWDLYEMDVEFILDSGDKVQASFDSGGYTEHGDWDKFVCYKSGKLLYIIDPDEIKAVVINGQIIELK